VAVGDPWLRDRPPASLVAGPWSLRRSHPSDLGQLVEAVNESLEQLRPWMPWAQVPADAASIGAFLRQADVSWDGGHEFQFAVGADGGGADTGNAERVGPIIGYCGLHDRLGAGALEIGYWVRSPHTGLGVATAAAGALTRAALALDGVERVEIRCDAANTKSRAVPPKLGYRLDRIDRRPPEAPGETDQHMIWVFPS
jgi:RimJ/RimL family protein N-acetyltransferase